MIQWLKISISGWQNISLWSSNPIVSAPKLQHLGRDGHCRSQVDGELAAGA